MSIVSRMYNEVLMQRRMAEMFFNWRQLALAANVDPKTAKTVVLTGKGQPQSIKAVARALKLTAAELIKEPNGKRRKTA